MLQYIRTQMTQVWFSTKKFSDPAIPTAIPVYVLNYFRNAVTGFCIP